MSTPRATIAKTGKVGLGAALMVALGIFVSAPALADDDQGHWHGWHHHGWGWGPRGYVYYGPAYAYPPPVVYAPPPVVYAPPPVVYAPPVYASPAISVVIPIGHR